MDETLFVFDALHPCLEKKHDLTYCLSFDLIMVSLVYSVYVLHYTHPGYTREEVIGCNCRFMQGPDTDPRAVLLVKSLPKFIKRHDSLRPVPLFLRIDFFGACKTS
jgi:hypothetical protein